MTWGIWGKNFNTDEMGNRISKNIDIGVTTFDHADIYGDYTTEKTFGIAFKHSGISRDKIQLISKCGIQLVNPKRNTVVKHYDYRKEYIIQQAEQSLSNLKTDYLDLFLLHRPSPLMQIEEIAEAIQILKRSGKVKAFGVSNFTPLQIDYLSSHLTIEANQIQCSLTHSVPLEDDSLFYHKKNDIMTMAWSPLGNFYQKDEKSKLKLEIKTLSSKYNCTESQLVLAWLLKHPAKIHPVLGTSKAERVEEAFLAQNIDMGLQDWFILYECARVKEVD